MPAILSSEDESKWLDLNQPMKQVLQLLEPYPEDLMEAFSISPLISKKGVDKTPQSLFKPSAMNSRVYFSF